MQDLLCRDKRKSNYYATMIHYKLGFDYIIELYHETAISYFYSSSSSQSAVPIRRSALVSHLLPFVPPSLVDVLDFLNFDFR